MNARSMHPAGQARRAPGLLPGSTIGVGHPGVTGPACCCPANPVVRVVMPATAGRPHRTELLLCGHHFRISRPALAAIRPTVTELRVPAGDRPEALLPNLPGPVSPLS